MVFPVPRWVLSALCFALIFASLASAQAQIRINEVIASNERNVFSDGSISDWVELFNAGGQAVALGGYSLTDDPATPREWVFPAGTSIAANGYLVVLLDSTRPASTTASAILNAGFGASADGDRVELYSPDAIPMLVDSVRFGPQAADYSVGRIPSGTGSFRLTRPTPNGANVEQALGSQAGLRINEWMASPTSGNDWFEVYNPESLPVQLTGLYFMDNGNVPSPVAPLTFVGVGLNGFVQFIADNASSDNEVNFGLSGNGDSIGLYRADNSQIDRVTFGQQVTGISQGRLPDGSGTTLNLTIPTPAESNLIRYEGLVVNELLSHTDPPLEDAVEFYNTTGSAINIGGWYLSDSRNDLMKYRIPDGTTVPAQGYIVFYQNQFNGAGAAKPFSFSSSSDDEVYLAQVVNGSLTGYIVEESFEASANGVSFGRVNTSVPGDYKFVAMIRPTFGVDNPVSVEQFRQGTGAANSGPRVGSVVINEIMYHPQSVDGVTDNTADEFIELLNITSQPVQLFDPAYPTNQWRIRGAVSYSFPPNTVLAANGAALIVSFDVNDATALAAFRSKYSVPQSVPVFGPYSGKLSNSSDEVELYRPDAPQLPGQPDAGRVPFIRVDKVNYSDVTPWPEAADGTGQSLQRQVAAAFGNDPANWIAALPTAGRTGTAPADEIRLSIQSTGATSPMQIQFNAVSGRSYTVQYRDDLSGTASWQTLTTVTASSSTVTVQDSNSVGRDQRYYRVVTP
ncbi:MAG: lamin tail domain-containing protein [Limisphaerales bacterium]